MFICIQPPWTNTLQSNILLQLHLHVLWDMSPPALHIYNFYLFILQYSTSSVSLDGEHLWMSISHPCSRFSFGFRSGFWLCHSNTSICFDVNCSSSCRFRVVLEGDPSPQSQTLHIRDLFPGFLFHCPGWRKGSPHHGTATIMWQCHGIVKTWRWQ